jgi:hypothetical protein
MMSMAPRFRLVVAIGLFAGLGSAPARADITKDQCIDANGKGQQLRREGKLMAARQQLRLCTDSACPAMVRDDCTKRLDDLEKAQPTIAFEVKDASGADVTAVKVTVDGKPLAERLDGAALPVDIGEHVFRFEVAGQHPITRTLVLIEGEKGRRERIAIGGATASLPAPVLPTAPSAAPVPGAHRPAGSAPVFSAIETHSTGAGMGTQKVLGLAAAGLGVAGIAVGSVFGVMTLSQKSQQQSDCGSSASCTSSGHAQAVNDHSTGMTDSTISTIGFIAGGALLVGGALLFFTAGHPSDSPSAAGMLVLPGVGPGGGGMLLRGMF